MGRYTRRTWLLGAAAASVAASLPGKARASIPAAITGDPGFRAWTAQQGAGGLPLQQIVETGAGAQRLGAWLDRRPTVLALWASWCAPCLIEKPHQAALAQRLIDAGAATRILALQAYDQEDVDLADARWMLDRIGARALPLARASAAAEAAFLRVFGARDNTRATLPCVFLIGGDGLELGRAIGPMHGVDGRSDYWQDEATFAFLSRLT